MHVLQLGHTATPYLAQCRPHPPAGSDGVFEVHHTPPARVARDVISWLVGLIAFPFVSVGIATRRVGEEHPLASDGYC